MYAGDTLLLMHGLRERTHGRPAYERAILLECTRHAGWMVFGLSDRTSRKMRGELVTILGACGEQLKYMRIQSEAVTDDDLALLQFFESQGMLIGPRRGDDCVYTTITTPPTASMEVCNTELVSWKYASIYSMDTIKDAIERYKAHYKPLLVDAGKEGEEQDPVSLYTLADYKRVKDIVPADVTTATATTTNVAAIVEETIPVSCIASSSTGTTTPVVVDIPQHHSPVPQPRSRSSRFVCSPGSSSSSSTAVPSAPANFQLFTSGMFGHKMTDILAGACYIIPQELLLLYGLLQEFHSKTEGFADSNKTSEENAIQSNIEKIDDNVNTTSNTTSNSSTTAPALSSVSPPAWLCSLLRPAEPDVHTALETLRTHLVETLQNPPTTSGGSAVDGAADGLTLSVAPSLLTLLEKVLFNCSFEGVIAVYDSSSDSSSSNSNSSGNNSNSPVVVKYAFELPAGNKMLMADLGITPGIVAAGLQSTITTSNNNSHTSQNTTEGNGMITVGYFTTPLEAALVREQVLGLSRSATEAHRTYSTVIAKSNFTTVEWNEIKRISRFVSKFTRKYCMP